jgi:hypothetical protein
MTTTTTTQFRTITLDIDPYNGHVTLSDTWLDGRAGGTAHFDQDTNAAMDELAFLVRIDARRALERAPWVGAA